MIDLVHELLQSAGLALCGAGLFCLANHQRKAHDACRWAPKCTYCSTCGWCTEPDCGDCVCGEPALAKEEI